MDAGRRDLCNAVVRLVGGFRRLAQLMADEDAQGAEVNPSRLLEACWNVSAAREL